jgi:hypothetical protein
MGEMMILKKQLFTYKASSHKLITGILAQTENTVFSSLSIPELGNI